jgi:hypothetical protein
MQEFVRLGDIVIDKSTVCSVEVKRSSDGGVHYVEIRTLGGRVDCHGKDADHAIQVFFQAESQHLDLAVDVRAA